MDVKSTKMEFDDLSHRIIGWAIEVHRHLGPGLFESAYEQCLAHELSRNNIDRLQRNKEHQGIQAA